MPDFSNNARLADGASSNLDNPRPIFNVAVTRLPGRPVFALALLKPA